MQKEVLIHVRGLQMMDAQGDQEPIEIIVPGQYYFGWTGDFLPRLLRAWMQRGIQGDLQKGEGGAFNLLLFRRR